MSAAQGDHMMFGRDTDRYLRRWALIAPVCTGFLGTLLGTAWGFVGAAYLYRDHEKRISVLERFRDERIIALEQFKRDQVQEHGELRTVLGVIQEHQKSLEEYLGYKKRISR